MIEKLIERFKQYKKQSFLNLPANYKKKYAFIGVGSHSISNLFPVIQHLAIPIEIIQSRTITNAEKMAKRFHASYTDSIDSICNNQNIDGVFVCVQPQHHFHIVKKLIQSNKHVFVDKPPCTNLEELHELISLETKHGVQCLVGLQRRYAPVYNQLANKCQNALSYQYLFHIGAYPEGNVYYELFIHPLDTIISLFGPTIDIQLSVLKHKKGLNLSMLTQHQNGTRGNVDISTLYSWKMIDEYLKINTPNEIFEASYPYHLVGLKLQKQIAGIPMEKIQKSSATVKKIYIQNNGLNPVKEENSIVYQGYAAEIETFTNIVEGNKYKNKSALKNLIATYELIQKIQSESL